MEPKREKRKTYFFERFYFNSREGG